MDSPIRQLIVASAFFFFFFAASSQSYCVKEKPVLPPGLSSLCQSLPSKWDLCWGSDRTSGRWTTESTLGVSHWSHSFFLLSSCTFFLKLEVSCFEGGKTHTHTHSHTLTVYIFLCRLSRFCFYIKFKICFFILYYIIFHIQKSLYPQSCSRELVYI